MNDASNSSEPKKKRRKQERAVTTRNAIIYAALNEFAERGFEGASLRRIGARADLEYTLITYHFRNKRQLWEAVAESEFRKIGALFAESIRDHEGDCLSRLRSKYRAFYEYTAENPAFHHFMLSENHSEDVTDAERLQWLISQQVEGTTMEILDEIRECQDKGQIMQGEPVLVHYLLLGMVTVLSSLNGEAKLLASMSVSDHKVREAYWALIDKLIFAEVA